MSTSLVATGVGESGFDSAFEMRRVEKLGPIDRLVYRQAQEILDLQPESAEAARVIRDLEHFSTRFGLDQKLGRVIWEKLNPRKNSAPNLLEVCAGSGWLSRRLLACRPPEFAKANILVTDLSGVAIADGLRRSQEHQENSRRRAEISSNLCWQVADATGLPFDDKQFDLVYCAQALHHFKPSALLLMLLELERVARQVVVFDLRRTAYGFLFVRLFAPFYSREFIHDGVVSHRRAYSLTEMRELIQEADVPIRVRRFLPVGMLLEMEAD